MRDSGLSGMINTGAALENDAGMTVLSIGRATTDDVDSAMEICGTWLCFRVTLRGPEIQLAAVRIDAGDDWDLLLRAPDSPGGWATLRNVTNALETHGVKSLERPNRHGYFLMRWVPVTTAPRSGPSRNGGLRSMTQLER